MAIVVDRGLVISIKEIWAALVALVVFIPLGALFVVAARDGESRKYEAPLQSLLGKEAYDAWMNGEVPAQHYFGADKLAPDFTLRDQNNRPWRLQDHRGKVVVMNFWTITCKPCVEEMPSLVELAEIARGRSDIEVVAVTVDAGWSDVSSIFPPNHGLRVLFDPNKSVVNEKYGTRLFPETWIIDPQGVIRLRIDGARDWSSPIALDVIRSFL
jgi:peroxiredoxin